MRDVIDLWQSATGDRVKDRPIGNPQVLSAAQPLRLPSLPAMAEASTNGHLVR